MRVILTFFLVLAATGAWAAEVYRSVAADGTVVYSDRPTGPDATPIALSVVEPSAPPAPAAARSSASASADSSQSPSSEPAQPSERERAEQRARNCEIARDRAERYSDARRLYRDLPDGEREYLTDDEIDAARARAAADVETWCN